MKIKDYSSFEILAQSTQLCLSFAHFWRKYPTLKLRVHVHVHSIPTKGCRKVRGTECLEELRCTVCKYLTHSRAIYGITDNIAVEYINVYVVYDGTLPSHAADMLAFVLFS